MAWKCEIEMTQKNKFNGILEEDFQVNPKKRLKGSQKSFRKFFFRDVHEDIFIVVWDAKFQVAKEENFYGCLETPFFHSLEM